jgi:hypothetical protein
MWVQVGRCETLTQAKNKQQQLSKATKNMQSTSLVKYHTPILVSITNAKGKKGQKKPAIEKTTTQTEDILNSILPPRRVEIEYIR